ncbi:hypothetical protein QYE76_004965 [Lolium multiflorum]|uniref:Uncharacterized protein n=1 Tax=Lolium multiflorum TaxID=4521 RepID=A0AAD8RS34_LOLMU|nr:hypothetical protein QYE76_004965 [Lolium multiflorum]
MKTVFTPRFVYRAQLFQPNLLVRAIDFIADNEEQYTEYLRSRTGDLERFRRRLRKDTGKKADLLPPA